ncbi:DUF4212 domain-containing protein [Ramlibacter sp. MAHUQ-53]
MALSSLPMTDPSDNHRLYWRKTLRLTAALLAVWFAVTFVVPFYARELSFDFFGWPFSFWMGAQGALIVYVLIIFIYARCMQRLDAEHGMNTDEGSDTGKPQSPGHPPAEG